MLDFWQRLPWWIRIPLSILVILVGIYVLASAAMAGPADEPIVNEGRRDSLTLGGLLIFVGLVMLALSFPGGPERRGYHF